MGLLLKGGRIADPRRKTLERLDVLIEGERIAAIGENLPMAGHTARDVTGMFVLPGLIDPHVHLREPGQAHKETIETGTKAAAAGGFTQICSMPNTSPAVDEPETVAWIIAEAERFGYATVHPFAAITKSLKGDALTDFRALKQTGAIGFSDDGRGVQSAGVMLAAMRAARELDLPIVVHAEDDSLANGGHIHAGSVAQQIGVKGIPNVAETAMVARDVWLAEAAGAHVHICHVSAGTAVAAVRQAKALGVRVTAEVAPHHLLLTDAAVLAFGANAKVNPPLRSEKDRLQCVQGLLDGTLDAVATDHAPHSEEEKGRGIERAPFGLVGLEISFPLLYTAFVKSGVLTLADLVYRMSTRPAELFRLAGGRLEVGGIADLAVIDPETERAVDPARFFSKGRNTPFAGRNLTGWPILTVHKGNLVYEA